MRAITTAGGSQRGWHRDYRSAAEIPPKGNTKCRGYPFGNDKDAAGTGNEYKFTGKEWDDESNLYYSWHRYYRSVAEIPPEGNTKCRDDPELGRFTQVDPLWQKYPSLSPYNYCANNPLTRVDPDGLADGLVFEFGAIGMFGTISVKQSYSIRFDLDSGFQLWSHSGFGSSGFSTTPSGGLFATAGVFHGDTQEGKMAYAIGQTMGLTVSGTMGIEAYSANPGNILSEISQGVSQSSVELSVGVQTTAMPKVAGGVQSNTLILGSTEQVNEEEKTILQLTDLNRPSM